MNQDQKQSVVKTPAPVKPQTAQPMGTVTDPKQATAPVKAAEQVKTQAVQPAVQAASPKQPTSTVKAPDAVKPQAVQTAVQATSSKQSTAPVKASNAVKSQPTQTTEVPTLSDVVPTSKVWISGLIGNRQIDCLGPIEIPLKIDEPTYPFTPVPSNPDYTNQVFDYDTSTWVPTDAKSQGQQLTDLTKAVADLQQTITKHEKDAETSQAMSMQQMQMLMSITAKLDALTKKGGVK